MATLFGREIDLLCLDLDDTLIDTEAGAPRRFSDARRLIRSIRPEIDERLLSTAIERALTVDPNRGRLANFLDELDIHEDGEVSAVRTAYFEQMPAGTELFTGTYEMLALLRERFRIALITNGPSDLQRRKVAHFDLAARVDWILVSGELGIEKPDRAIFQHALDLAGVAADRAAHVGDSLDSDVAGANRAGLLSVWVETRFPREVTSEPDPRPDETIAHIRELLDA